MNSALLAEVDALILSAIRDGTTPGAALAIGRHGKLVRLRGYGTLDYTEGSAAVSPSTIYDVSSLTKVAGTTIGMMRHVEAGRIKVDDPLSRYLAWWPNDGCAGRIRIRHLLDHTSGLPSGADLSRGGKTRAARLRRIARLPIRSEPGSMVMYSDLGMVLLGAVLERQQGLRLDDYLRQRVFRPLKLQETLFRPAEDAPRLLARIAPTEMNDQTGRPFRGIVHDPIARSLNGVAGHAGLFSSARDLATIAQVLLNGSQGKAGPLARIETIRSFSGRGLGGRCLGFDLPSDLDYTQAAFFPIPPSVTPASPAPASGSTRNTACMWFCSRTGFIPPRRTRSTSRSGKSSTTSLLSSVTDQVVQERAPVTPDSR